MTDPLDKATSKAPPTVGEGCLSRYDVDSLTDEDGATFDGAAELWQQLQQAPNAGQAPVPGPLDNPGNCE
ncbi:hypothetical protein [Pseudomonas huanghezhanensis]|uniref:hypothetical protein n=1 Tax=Pseudomonas huanghezhanensis TaxID=3002903 RepID=UPI002286197A|nr:hypothetical protein [Pseudomonas sp. BSw22131]